MKHSLLILALTGVSLVACGPSKQLQTANAQVESLNAQVATLNTKVADYDKQVNQLNSQIAQQNVQAAKVKAETQDLAKEAESCRKAKEAIAQRFENLNKALVEHGTSMQELKQKAGKALNYFNDAGCTVTYKDGLIHITMPEKIVFNNNSTKVSDQGKQVISVLADVMDEYKGLTAYVLGNSDATVVSGTGSNFKDNWSLSSERAIAVVRVLRDKYNIDPVRMTPGGRSKYHPIADNNTAEGRAANRRIEVILEPDYQKIWEMSENK